MITFYTTVVRKKISDVQGKYRLIYRTLFLKDRKAEIINN